MIKRQHFLCHWYVTRINKLCFLKWSNSMLTNWFGKHLKNLDSKTNKKESPSKKRKKMRKKWKIVARKPWSQVEKSESSVHVRLIWESANMYEEKKVENWKRKWWASTKSQKWKKSINAWRINRNSSHFPYCACCCCCCWGCDTPPIPPILNCRSASNKYWSPARAKAIKICSNEVCEIA